MNSADELPETVDLSNCDREPIHIPDAIQSHGCLLAYSTDELRLIGYSDNVTDWLESSPSFGEPLSSTFSDRFEAEVRNVLQGPKGIVRHVVCEPLPDAAWKMHSPPVAAVHAHDGRLLIELESPELRSPDVEILNSLPLRLNLANQRFQSTRTVEELYTTIADEVRDVSGYDRVMVYRFFEEGHGAVVGEAVGDRFERFLGLHYPATDIPQPARRLYLLNTVRSIADVEAEPVAIRCEAGSPPVDLSYSCFRAVSPIHVEYLKNMGVRASMSISIIDEAQLWGLIACHHYEPRTLSFQERAACEMLGLTAATYLTARERDHRNESLSQRRSKHASLMRDIAGAEHFNESLTEGSETLCNLVDADGVAICWRGGPILWGDTPEAAVVSEIAESYLKSNDGLSASESLVEDAGLESSLLNSSRGVLAVPLSAPDLRGLLFFRNEYLCEVHWAGNPEKAAEVREDGVRLSPRLSFEKWSEIVQDRSRQWSGVDLEVGEDIRGGMVELLGRRAAQLAKINAELTRLNDDLDSFAYAASHDLREPLRGLNHNVFLLNEEMAELPDDLKEVKQRCQSIGELSGRMDELVKGLLRLARAGRGDLELENLDLSTVVDDALIMIWESGQPDHIAVEIDDQTGPIKADYACLRELLSNLIANAAKYNDNEKVRITVRSHRDTNRRSEAGIPPVIIEVEDNGIGIASDHVDRIFQLFRRTHASDAYGGGTGAGLAIVKKIVQRHGGDIWVHSSPGAGSKFSMTLEASD
ncbi:MAG: GAF domain-containing protein [Planctomycetaceae bacterium]|nr:GAF domain-containing protein [Planctomycetaceae bacterium]